MVLTTSYCSSSESSSENWEYNETRTKKLKRRRPRRRECRKRVSREENEPNTFRRDSLPLSKAEFYSSQKNPYFREGTNMDFLRRPSSECPLKFMKSVERMTLAEEIEKLLRIDISPRLPQVPPPSRLGIITSDSGAIFEKSLVMGQDRCLRSGNVLRMHAETLIPNQYRMRFLPLAKTACGTNKFSVLSTRPLDRRINVDQTGKLFTNSVNKASVKALGGTNKRTLPPISKSFENQVISKISRKRSECNECGYKSRSAAIGEDNEALVDTPVEDNCILNISDCKKEAAKVRNFHCPEVLELKLASHEKNSHAKGFRGHQKIVNKVLVDSTDIGKCIRRSHETGCEVNATITETKHWEP